MKKLLVICPSRQRPEKCKEMYDSFMRTSKMADLRICVDYDDPDLAKYVELFVDNLSIAKVDLTVTNFINIVWQEFTGYEYYSVTNDDFIYHTDGWDLKLIGEIVLHGKYGIAYGNDLLQGVTLPTTSIVSAEITKALGWLQMPKLMHLFGDNVWKLIGSAAQCLYYRPDVIIEHKHYFSKKVDKDETFNKTNSREMYDLDSNAFLDWHATQAKDDIEKVKKLF